MAFYVIKEGKIETPKIIATYQRVTFILRGDFN